MGTTLVQVRLDDRIVAAMGDVRKSAFITQAIVEYAHLDPSTYLPDRVLLTPNVTQYAGGAKPISTSRQHLDIANLTPPGKPCAKTRQPVDSPRAKVSQADYDYRAKQLAKHPHMLASLATELEVDPTL